MVELQSKITESGVLYIPKEIRECFGRNMKIIPNASAVIFFSADTSYENVLASAITTSTYMERYISKVTC